MKGHMSAWHLVLIHNHCLIVLNTSLIIWSKRYPVWRRKNEGCQRKLQVFLWNVFDIKWIYFTSIILGFYKHLNNLKNLCFHPGPEIIELFSCSTQLSMKFILLINVKMPTIVGILTFISMIKARKFFFFFQQCTFYEIKFHTQLSWAQKKFYNLKARPTKKNTRLIARAQYLKKVELVHP